MGRSEKSKRVTWASDVNLCQVRLFLSEDSPSQIRGNQDHLQAKALWAFQSGSMVPDDNLPPGFEGIQPGNLWRVNSSQIPLIKWKCPLRFEVNRDWVVVAGEESTETEAQNQRELRVLEAIYPRPSAIPPNPLLMGVDDSTYNDHNTLRVPITPIEDEDGAMDASSGSMVDTSSSSASFHPNVSEIPATGVEPSIIAALSSIASVPGTSIDPGLLVKILSDPKIVEKLVTNLGSSSSLQNRQPIGMPPNLSQNMQNIPSTSAQYTPNPRPMPNVSQNMQNMATTTGPLYPPTAVRHISNIRPSVPDMIPAPTPSMPKDINYYKSLIQQHGAERRETVPQFAHQNQEHSSTPKLRDSKPKVMKPCLYFNTSRGCRNGANCTFQHDASSQQRVSGVPDVQASKRMKLDREITGT